ncbi:MAG: efflux RND transporter periplasmic adaptor subunit [Chloroflexales bacterium]|nr:efflux RND transporter periplasmic adaptor subunit [Chloroflexales bacterium]
MTTLKQKWRWPMIMMSVVVLFLVGTCVGLSVMAQGVKQKINQTSAPPSQIDTVERRDLTDAVKLNGKLEPVERAELGFGATSRLAEVLVAPGDRVTKDQPLARLETRDLEQAVESARAALAQAEANLAKLSAGPTAQEVANAEQSVLAARGSLVQVQQRAANARQEREQAQINARDQLAQARNQLDQQRVQAQQERDQASLAKTSAERALVQATSALSQAQTAYSKAYWRLEYVERTGFSPETEGQPAETLTKLNSFQRAEFRIQFKQAETALRDAERAVAQAQVAYEQAQRDEVARVQRIEAQTRAAEQTFQQREAELLAQVSPEELAKLRPEHAGVAQARIDAQHLQGQSEQNAQAAAAAGLEAAIAQRAQVLQGAAVADLARAHAQLAQSQSQLTRAEARLANATLRAPFDGLVITVKRRAGETVAENGSVITLVRNDQLVLTGTVDEIDILRLKKGQTATIQVDALPTQVLSGTLTRVAAAPAADSQNQGAASRYAVRVLIERPDPQVRLGMAATARIIAANKPNALVLPLRALREENGQTFVERIIPDQAAAAGSPPTERVNVKVGVRTPEGVEIVDGLQAGDQVFSPTLPTPVPMQEPVMMEEDL